MAVVEINPNNVSNSGGGHFNIIYIKNTNKELPSLPTDRKIQEPLQEQQRPQLYYELKRLFLNHDHNKDSRLSKNELCKAFAALNSRFPAYRAWLARFESDLNHDGYISWVEFDALISSTMKWLDSKFEFVLD